MTQKKVMTIAELLAWAYEETQMAEALERLLYDIPEDLRPVVQAQIKKCRERSLWLDHQVEYALDTQDEEVNRE